MNDLELAAMEEDMKYDPAVSETSKTVDPIFSFEAYDVIVRHVEDVNVHGVQVTGSIYSVYNRDTGVFEYDSRQMADAMMASIDLATRVKKVLSSPASVVSQIEQTMQSQDALQAALEGEFEEINVAALEPDTTH